MVQRTVYVSSQGLYYDTEDGELRSPQAFRAKHTGVTPFGSSGQKTADAIFPNAPDAQKVSTIAVKPGAPVRTETKTESGMSVMAAFSAASSSTAKAFQIAEPESKSS